MAEPAHILRLKGVVRLLQTVMEKDADGSGMARMAFFMTTLTDELAEELAELPESHVRGYMFQIGEVISWIGHGDNDRLPDSVKEFAYLITGKEANGSADEPAGSHTELDTQTR